MGHFPARQTETRRFASRFIEGGPRFTPGRGVREQEQADGEVNCDAAMTEASTDPTGSCGAGRAPRIVLNPGAGLRLRTLTRTSHCMDAPGMWHTAEQGISLW